MRGIVAAAMLAAAFGIAVYVVTRSPEDDHRGLSAGELPWAGRYGLWRSRERVTLERAYAASRSATTLGELAAPFRPLEACVRSYRVAVGTAPRGLRDVERAVISACGEARRAVRELAGNPTVSNPSRTRHVIYAIRALENADRLLEAHLLLETPLPVTVSLSDASSIDPELSAAATDATIYDVEVRCWSKDDWPQVRRELNALGRATWPHYIGAASVWGLAAQLSPETCATLAELADGKAVEPVRAVRALATLGREAERVAGAAEGPDVGCYALQDVRLLAIALGRTRGEVGRLADLAWRLYKANELPPGRHSPRCQRGSVLDKDAASPWP